MLVEVPPRPDLPPPSGPSRRRARWIATIVVFGLLASASGVGALVEVLDRSPARPGDPTAYAFLNRRLDGAPVRWNPCQPIHYVVNTANAPAGALDVLQRAADEVASASGIRLIYDGTTERTPEVQLALDYTDTSGDAPRPLPVLIAWLPAEGFKRFAPPKEILAVGLPQEGGSSNGLYTSGMIVVNAAQNIPTMWLTRYSLGPVLMHEWGHVLGLAHVDDPQELMWSDAAPGAEDGAIPDLTQTDWGAGDLAGLEQVGRTAGCLTDDGWSI